MVQAWIMANAEVYGILLSCSDLRKGEGSDSHQARNFPTQTSKWLKYNRGTLIISTPGQIFISTARGIRKYTRTHIQARMFRSSMIYWEILEKTRNGWSALPCKLEDFAEKFESSYRSHPSARRKT